MLQAVDSLNLATDVKFAGGSEEILDGGMRLIIAAENLLGLEHPVIFAPLVKSNHTKEYLPLEVS